MQSAMDAAKGSSFEPVMFLLKGNSQCSLGKIRDARQTYAQGSTIAQKAA